MKKTILLLLLTLGASSTYSQNWLSYSYDATGNRIYRQTATIRAKKMTRSLTDSLSAVGYDKYQVSFDDNNFKVKIGIANWTKTMQGNICVYDLAGRELYSESIATAVTTIDLSRLEKGTFILCVSIDGEKWTRKFSK